MVELEKRTIALVVVFFLIGVGVGFPMGRYTAPTTETTETVGEMRLGTQESAVTMSRAGELNN